MNRDRLLRGLQYVVAAGAFAWVLTRADWGRTIRLLADVDPPLLALVVAVTGFEFVTRFSMWFSLLNGRARTPFRTAARVDLVIKFVNHLVPSKASGQSIAPVVIRQFTDHDWNEAITIAGLNTGLYGVLYGTVSLIGLAVFWPRLSIGLIGVIGLSTALYLGIGSAILAVGRRLDAAASRFDGVGSRIASLPILGAPLSVFLSKLPSFTRESAATFRDLSGRPGVLAVYALGWAGTLMVIPGIRVFALLTAMGATFTPAYLLPVSLVMAYSVTLLPITPGGVGVAELSGTLVLVALGVPHAVAVPAVLLDRFLGVYLPALLGWYPMLEVDLSELGLSRG